MPICVNVKAIRSCTSDLPRSEARVKELEACLSDIAALANGGDAYSSAGLLVELLDETRDIAESKKPPPEEDEDDSGLIITGTFDNPESEKK